MECPTNKTRVEINQARQFPNHAAFAAKRNIGQGQSHSPGRPDDEPRRTRSRVDQKTVVKMAASRTSHVV